MMGELGVKPLDLLTFFYKVSIFENQMSEGESDKHKKLSGFVL